MVYCVSIRASLQQRGELGALPGISRTTAFQSAPHFSSEANALTAHQRALLYVFQSAPHFSSEANRVETVGMISPALFQSAPHFSSEANDLYSGAD